MDNLAFFFALFMTSVPHTLGAGLSPVCEGRSTQFFAGIVQTGSQNHEKISCKILVIDMAYHHIYRAANARRPLKDLYNPTLKGLG